MNNLLQDNKIKHYLTGGASRDILFGYSSRQLMVDLKFKK